MSIAFVRPVTRSTDFNELTAFVCQCKVGHAIVQVDVHELFMGFDQIAERGQKMKMGFAFAELVEKGQIPVSIRFCQFTNQ